MHQDHNIPWNTLAAQLVFIRDNKHITPRRTDLFVSKKATQPNVFNHFAKCLAKTISSFSYTERAKFPVAFDPLLSGKLFSDNFRDRHPEYLNRRNQLIQTWIAAAAVHPEYGPAYCTRDGDLADVVKILLHENELSTLIMLAQHPQIPLHHLHNLSWGHHFGFSRIGEAALAEYIFFNVVVAKGLVEGGEYKEMDVFRRNLRDIAGFMDHDAQTLPYRTFFGDIDPWNPSAADAPMNFPRLHEHLKLCFSFLYRYDMILKEYGVLFDWEGEIMGLLRYWWK
ncbi:hypothetical protein BJ138DRAFT_1147828 [Hygrophoropsis aurantiaca]|uniref:Uncharacterized protein n=1 Tax=Hygrophoropsis aurantiaca TaxID=72124 RepID=A0ACB8AHM8_9AGAM|nr:hypothetical protein BJ138DRAFT_1147828 [Hygrophoropsis aurantiaca]